MSEIGPNVVPFHAVSEKHCQGTARCLSCKGEWQAIVHFENRFRDDLECPYCAKQMGLIVFAYAPPPGTPVFVCNCGNDRFYILEDGGSLCPACGVTTYDHLPEGTK